MKITLITSNKNKGREFKTFLEPEIRVEHLEMEYPELRSDNPKEIVELAAKQLAEKLNQSVIVEDSGLFIEALKDFPGTCTKYIFQRIGNEGIIKLLKGIKNRKCFYRSAIGYCKPGGKPISFLGQEEGTISLEIRGEKGWGQDPIFIPKINIKNNNNQKTYGETRKEGDINLFRKDALIKFKRFLNQI